MNTTAQIKFGGIPEYIKRARLSQAFLVCLKLSIGHRQRWIKRNLPLVVAVARKQEIKSDWRVRVRPWLE